MFNQNVRRTKNLLKKYEFGWDHADNFNDIDYYVSITAVEFSSDSLPCEMGVQYCSEI